MSRQVIIVIFTFAAFSVYGCQGGVEESQQRLFDTFAEMDKSIQAGNLDEFVSHYADPAYHLPPGSDRNSTRSEIKDFLDDTLGLYELDADTEIHFSDDASMAFVYGSYEIKEDKSKGIEAFRGRFISVWKRDDDRWYTVVDIWNTDDPRFAHL